MLANAGATLPRRDAVDERIIQSVRSGEVMARKHASAAADLEGVGYTAATIQSILALIEKGIISDIRQVGGYPKYQGQPYPDADGDGLPDDWETRYGLNPKEAADAVGDLNNDGYTNIEDFINGLDPRAPKQDWSDPKRSIDARNVTR